MVEPRLGLALGVLGLLMVSGISAEVTDTTDITPIPPVIGESQEPENNQTNGDELPFTPTPSNSGELNVSEIIEVSSDGDLLPVDTEIRLSNLEKNKNYTIVSYNKNEEYRKVEKFNSGSSGLEIVNTETKHDALLRKNGYLFQLYKGDEKVSDFYTYPELSIFYMNNFNDGSIEEWNSTNLDTFKESNRKLIGKVSEPHAPDYSSNVQSGKLYWNKQIEADKTTIFSISSGFTEADLLKQIQVQFGSEPSKKDYGTVNLPNVNNRNNLTVFHDSGEIEVNGSSGKIGSVSVPSDVEENGFYIQFKVKIDTHDAGNGRIKIHEMASVPKTSKEKWNGLKYIPENHLDIKGYDITESTPSSISFRNNKSDWTKFPSELGKSNFIEFKYEGDPEKFEIISMKSQDDTEKQKSLLSIFG